MEKFKKLYWGCAGVLLNTLLLFIALNVFAGLAIGVKNALQGSKPTPDSLFTSSGAPVDNGKRTGEMLTWYDLSATNVGEERAAQTLDEFHDLVRAGSKYQPWVQYAEKPFEGRVVNFEQSSFMKMALRRTVHPARRPEQTKEKTIFAFGGSTTYGYFVADDQTWPTYLAEQLNAEGGTYYKVTNFGQVGYTESQESALFLWLLRNGHTPDVAIFMDGVNVFPNDVPQHTARMERAAALEQGRDPLLERRLAVKYLAKKLTKLFPAFKLVGKLIKRKASPPLPDPRISQNNEKSTAARFIRNQRLLEAICREFDTRGIFCIQPNAFTDYPLELMRHQNFSDKFLERRERQKKFYQAVAEAEGFLHLEGLFEEYGVGSGKKAVLDYCHYTPAFNKFLAKKLHQELAGTRNSR